VHTCLTLCASAFAFQFSGSTIDDKAIFLHLGVPAKLCVEAF
jgi:hypothetical protein